MSRILRYAHNVVNVQGDTIPYRTCWDIENITNDNSNVGHWGASNPGGRYANAIAGRNGSRKHPSTIRCNDFRFDREGNNILIPDYAHVTGIIVQYNYRKKSYSSTAHGSFGNPVISIPNLGLSGTGNAPPRNDFTEYNVYFGNLDLKGSDVNRSDFTVLFDLPENTSTNPCYIEMKYLRVYIDFDLPNYIPSISLDKSELKYGENLKISCKLNETNGVMASEQCSALLTIPEGFNIVSAPSNFNTTTKIWSPLTKNFTANMELEVTLSDRNVYGDFIFKITEQMTWNSQEARLNENSQEGGLFVLKPQVEMASFYLENHEVTVSEGNNKHYASLEIQIKNPAHDTVKLEMDFGGLTVEGNPTGLDKNTGIITINNWDANDLYDVQILLYSTEVGDYTISMISDSFRGAYADTVKVHLPDNLEPYYTMFALDDEALENLEEGYTYTFGCLCKITDTTTATVQASSTVKNLRASIIHGNDEIFTNQLSQAGDWELLKCEFVYNPTKQIYCKFYGNYTTYDFGKISFGDIFLIRSDKYSGYEYPTLKFRDTSKLKANGLYTTLLLEPPELSTSTKHYFSIFDYLGLDKAQSIVIHGLEVSGDVSTEGIINIILGFGHEHIDELDYHLDSLNLDENSTNFKLGGKFRSFGISFKDVLNLLNDIKFYLQIDDVMDNVTPIEVSMRNICLTVYYSLNASPCDFKINGVSSNHYCIELNAESEIPRGVKYDVNKYEIEGSDGEFVNKVNIRHKKLKLKFSAYG
ncbi:MAG: hypothetical protein K6A34_01170, partial [Methanobrevibacter sp.]|nr:hypothetical protein [Methanobrevibacter sp.]